MQHVKQKAMWGRPAGGGEVTFTRHAVLGRDSRRDQRSQHDHQDLGGWSRGRHFDVLPRRETLRKITENESSDHRRDFRF